MDDGPQAGTRIDYFLNVLGKRRGNPIVNLMVQKFKQLSGLCFGKAPANSRMELSSVSYEFPLSDHPSIVLHILTSCDVDPCDLARLEATYTFFRNPATFPPDNGLSIPELAALDMCQKRTMFKSMKTEERNLLKQKCGGSWKLVLKFLLAGEEACPRREKSQVAAGFGHSVVVSSQGAVYSFGSNGLGQLGHGTLQNERHPRLISSLQGIRVVQAVAKAYKTMLVSDCGKVYAFGTLSFGESVDGTEVGKSVTSTTPQLVESLKDIFVVQIAIGQFFTAALSREGRVYTLSWGKENKLVHQTEPDDLEPRPLDGELENLPVVQISAGYCYLLALAFQPSGMLVYSVGCGLGGKLGHGTTEPEPKMRLVTHLQTLNIEPTMVAAGTWHIAVMAKDGRVCTWGWGHHGCLGHGDGEFVTLPKVVDALNQVKAVHVATGNYTTFVVSENGEVYSFGCNSSSNLGLGDDVANGQEQLTNILIPKLVASLKQVEDRIAQISPTKAAYYNGHTLVLTESGKLYAFGWGENGELGVKIP